MSDWRFLSKDGDVVTYFRYKDGRFEYKTSQDVEPLLNMNRQALNNESGNWKGDMHHVASIPMTLWMEWCKEFGGDPMAHENQPRLMRKLMDREFAKVRVKSGRL